MIRDEKPFVKDNVVCFEKMRLGKKFISATIDGDLWGMACYLREGVDVDFVGPWNGAQYTAFHFAAIKQNVEMMDFLLKKGADKDKKMRDGRTALEWARERHATKTVKFLEGL